MEIMRTVGSVAWRLRYDLIGVLAVFALSQQGALYAEVQGGRTDDLLPTAAIADVQASVAAAHLATVEMAALEPVEEALLGVGCRLLPQAQQHVVVAVEDWNQDQASFM